MLQGQPVGDVEAGPGMPYIEDGTEEEEQEEEEEEEEAGDAEAGPAMPYFEDGTEEEEEEGDIEAGPAMPYFEEEEEAAAAGEEEEEGEAEGEEGEGEDAAAAEEKEEEEEEEEEEREEEAAGEGEKEEEEAVIKTGLRIAIPVSLTAAAGIIAVLTGFVGNKSTSTTPNFLFKASFTSMCATFLFGLFLILLAMLRSSIPCRLIAIVRSLALAAMVSLALVVGFGASFYFLRDG